MSEEKKYYKYEFIFDSKDLEIREMDYYENETLNETNIFVNTRGVYEFYMYSDSKDNIDIFMYQISSVLSNEMRAASRLYHLACGRCNAFSDFWEEYNKNDRRK